MPETTQAKLAWYRVFPATADQAGEARRFLAGLLGGHPAAADAIACLGELVGNSVRHSDSARPGGTFSVRLRRSGAAIRIEVTDQGGVWRAGPGGDDEHGRGLMIVRALAADWGITTDLRGHRTVWFVTRR